MNNLIRAYIFLAFFAVTTTVGAQNFSPTAIIDRAVAAYNAATTMSVEFDQNLYNPLTGNRSSARGTMLRQKPGLLSVTFSKPAKDRIVADGKNIWIYLPSSAPGQVIKMDAGDLGSLDPTSQFVSNPKARYKIVGAGTGTVNGRATHALVLTPKSGNSPFTRAKIWVDDKDASIRKFEITEPSGLVRTVTARAITTGIPMRGTAFQFAVPKGVRVVAR